MTDEEITAWLHQEYEQPFEGWDFSYVKSRRTPLGVLPWDYKAVAVQYLCDALSVLDIDTGGGEVLAGLLDASKFEGRAQAVEAYSPNVSIARKVLRDLKVDVIDTSEGPAPFVEGTFDLIIDRHGGSLPPPEVFRILSPGGHYITEQIGNQTNRELRETFDAQPAVQPDWPHNAADAAHIFEEIGFEIETLEEHSFPIRFADAGALVYYLKAVPWEVPGFSIEKHSKALIELHQVSIDKGFAIDATYHAYLLVARKP